MKNIYIGTEDFQEIIESNGYYVDKTNLIEKLIKTIDNPLKSTII